MRISYKIVKKKTFLSGLLECFINILLPRYFYVEVVEYCDAIKRWYKFIEDIAVLTKMMYLDVEFEPMVNIMLQEYVDKSSNLREALDTYEKEHSLTSK